MRILVGFDGSDASRSARSSTLPSSSAAAATST